MNKLLSVALIVFALRPLALEEDCLEHDHQQMRKIMRHKTPIKPIKTFVVRGELPEWLLNAKSVFNSPQFIKWYHDTMKELHPCEDGEHCSPIPHIVKSIRNSEEFLEFGKKIKCPIVIEMAETELVKLRKLLEVQI